MVALKGSAGRRARLGTAVILLLTATVPAALALNGCSASNRHGATVTPASRSPGPSLPTVARNESETIAAYTQTVTRLEEPGAVDGLVALYADDARMEDRAYGATSLGRDQIRSYWTRYFTGGVLSDKVVATYVGDGCALVESLASSPGVVALPTAEIIKLDGGRISTHYVYYYDGQIGREVEPLQTRAATGDTADESLRAAQAYLAALRATDATALGEVYAADVVYRDTAHNRSHAGSDAAIRAHAAIFAMKGIAFVGDETVAGPGWAAVMWRRTDREGHRIAFPDLPDVYLQLAQRPTIAGVTVLEVRDGKVARETVYCDHLRTRL